MAKQPGKKEFRLEFSDRNGAVELEGYIADARRIQNVLFGHGRAGDYGLGVDVQSYLHEFADPKTKDLLTEKAKTLVMKYCPGVKLNELVVDYMAADQDPTRKKGVSLVIGVSIGSDGRPYEFALVAKKDAKANVVSTLVL
jgi:hypothetical protein